MIINSEKQPTITKTMFVHRFYVRLNRTMIIIKPENQSAFLEKYD